MTDLVERLRKEQRYMPTFLAQEAADEIERLREALATCRELREGDQTQQTALLVRLRTLETQCFKLRAVVSLLSSNGAELLAAARNALEKE